ncbi:methylmalonyl-CoA epimerase [Thermoactinomyces sp. AMNI-1]|uniref:Methylmalonyl-CoA epimerase n=1 Tax=Thermoactinomyces mirandus TaxID=2756294 RepID=A0A7W1XPS6_9BACL|nr:methylmalonyl-CoA epimerase [Thermoactinomyces mirandus]
MNPKKISHIGIAVNSLDEVIPFYRDVLGLAYEGEEAVESEQVRVAFFRIGESRIELLEPLSEESAIYKFLQKKGQGIHHIALEVCDIKQRISDLKQKGVRMIQEEPKAGAHQMNIAFLHPGATGKVLYEICEPQHREE